MIIDFHTHIFPDKIAERTLSHLSATGGIPAHSNGRVDGLIERMAIGGTDVSVTLPVLTSPTQFDSVIRFATEINERYSKSGEHRLISFAGIHPACENIEGKMRLIKESGFLGVKIHPDYQGRFITDAGYIRIVECAREYDLIVVTHAGVDGAFRDAPVKCTPALAKELVKRVPHKKLVFAHLGANEMANEVIDTLAGEDVYLDTAYVLRYTDRDTFMKILEKHGEDRILFATDSPWSDISVDVQIIKSFNLGRRTEEKIFAKNAMTLLGIN